MKQVSMNMRLLMVAVTAMFVVSCGRNAASEAEAVEIERFDRAVSAYPMADSVERVGLIDSFRPAVEMMSRMLLIGNGDSLMESMGRSQAVAVFQPDVEEMLPDLSGVEKNIGRVKANFEEVVGQKFPSHIYGVVTPYNQSVMIADSIVMIGLNHYLGADYEGYQMMDRYALRLKTEDRIAYDLAEALVRTAYPFEFEGQPTVAAILTYEGAVVMAVERLMGDEGAARALGYDEAAMQWLEENRSEMWRRLAEDGVVYSTDQNVAVRLVAPAPYSNLFSTESPGRAGRYIGYAVVDSYLKNMSGVTLQSFLRNRKYADDRVIVDSKYTGR